MRAMALISAAPPSRAGARGACVTTSTPAFCAILKPGGLMACAMVSLLYCFAVATSIFSDGWSMPRVVGPEGSASIFMKSAPSATRLATKRCAASGSGTDPSIGQPCPGRW